MNTSISYKDDDSRHQWLTSVILVNWQAEVRTIMVQGQPGQIVHKTPSLT
jgi:hypothetical protein